MENKDLGQEAASENFTDKVEYWYTYDDDCLFDSGGVNHGFDTLADAKRHAAEYHIKRITERGANIENLPNSMNFAALVHPSVIAKKFVKNEIQNLKEHFEETLQDDFQLDGGEVFAFSDEDTKLLEDTLLQILSKPQYNCRFGLKSMVCFNAKKLIEEYYGKPTDK